MSLSREISTLNANWQDFGLPMAWKYLQFRWLFSVHSRPVSWALSHLAPYPRLLEVEISTACDLRCTMCELGATTKPGQKPGWGQSAKFMRYPQLVKILDEFPELIWIDITGIGEGLVNPEFMDMVREIKRRDIYLELFDPFHRWDPTITERMLDWGLNRIQPSVDGATKKTYESIRRGANFDVVCANLHYLFQAKKRRGMLTPVVDFHFIVQEANEHEMEQFVVLVRKIAGQQRVGVQFTEILREFDGIEAKKVPITEERMASVRATAKREDVDVWFNRNSQGRKKADMANCNAYHMPFVFVDGDVVPCCAQNERGDRPWQKHRAMGNVLRDSFRDIWRGERYDQLRRMFRKGEEPPYCEECPVFQARSRR